MTLTVGTQLGSFEITGQLGAGGMGEVWRATDKKLGREVAIKTLPASLADDADRLARFEREAKLLATLNHAHIATVHSLDETDGTLYIVMELVEGESLEERLKSGPLPLEDALHLGLQIASALEAAHEKGVVHRDLKPANIMITPDGVAKVLDFGLAKAFTGNPNEASPAHSPALSAAMTQAGLVLGTAGYMSPEQASGQGSDQRADIWAFGVVFYEMLTGQPVFSGESVPHILADVLKTTPDWKRLPENLHPRLRLMLERCLEKKPRDRYAGIADVRVDIERVLHDPEGTALASGSSDRNALPSRRPVRSIAAAFTAGLAVSGIAIWFLLRADTPPLMRFDVTPAEDFAVSISSPSLAISPDGNAIAYLTLPVGGGPGGRQLRLRRLDQLVSTVLVDLSSAQPGSPDQAYSPFFSPDGTQIGYYDAVGAGGGTLKRVSVQGGAPSTITALPGILRGASWGDDDTIVYATTDADSGLWRVRATGGEPEQLTTPDASSGASDHFWPEMLPGAEAVLFTVAKASEDESEIAVLSLVSGEQRTLLTGGSSPRYSASGHLLYGRAGTLFAVPFDARNLELRGSAVPVVERVTTKGAEGATEATISADGTLLYLSRNVETPRRLLWVDSAGRETEVPTPPRRYDQVVLSPDETRAAVRVEGDTSVWIADLERGTLQRLNGVEPSIETVVLVFSDDGREIVYSVRRADGGVEVLRQPIDNSARPELVASFGVSNTFPAGGELVPGGNQILLSVGSPSVDHDIGIVDIGDPDSYRGFIASSAEEYGAEIRTGGTWVAFGSNESGTVEAYVQRFPDGGGRRPVTIGGAIFPSWTGDGRNLMYIESAGATSIALMRLPVLDVDGSAESLEFGSPERLFPWNYYQQFDPRRQFGMTADGERFLVISLEQSSTDSNRMVLVQNWFGELERLAPVD